MQRRRLHVGVACAAAVAAALLAAAPAPASPGPRATASTALALRLERILAPGENLAFSPLSLQDAFAMADAGARGRTRAQLTAALRLAPDGLPLHRAMARLRADLAERPQLQVADSVWAQSGYPVRASYLALLQRYYGAALQEADFVHDPEAARSAINTWIADRTAGRIADLFPQGSIGTLTRLVLADAVYLKADWAEAFDPANTRAAPFHRLDGTTASVPMMTRTGTYAWMHGRDVSAVELPYTGGALAMDVLVPDEGRFAAFERRLDTALVARAIKALHAGELSLSLPRFTVSSGFDLVGTLRRLGVSDAFLPGVADFSALSPRARQDGLHIAQVRHKAWVQVDETGTEADAATGIGAEVTAAPPGLAIDRPFFFVIRDRPTGAVLFFGRVLDPSA